MDLYERYERYDALLCHFRRHIQRYCAARARSAEETAVLAQEVSAALWRAVDGLEASIPSAGANRWLQRVMRSAVADYLRANPAVATQPLATAAAITADGDEGAELLDDLAAYLGPDERALLHDFCSGYSYDELAAARGISAATLRVRMHRLRQHLKTIYSKLYE